MLHRGFTSLSRIRNKVQKEEALLLDGTNDADNGRRPNFHGFELKRGLQQNIMKVKIKKEKERNKKGMEAQPLQMNKPKVRLGLNSRNGGGLASIIKKIRQS